MGEGLWHLHGSSAVEVTGSSPSPNPLTVAETQLHPQFSPPQTPFTPIIRATSNSWFFLREVGSSVSGHSEHCRLGPLSVCPLVASPPSPSCPQEGKQAETCGSSREAACYQHPHAQPDRTMASILFTLDPRPSHSIRALTGTCPERIGLLQ